MVILPKNAEWCYCRVCGNYEELWLTDNRICPYCQGGISALKTLDEYFKHKVKSTEEYIKQLRNDPEYIKNRTKHKKWIEKLYAK